MRKNIFNYNFGNHTLHSIMRSNYADDIFLDFNKGSNEFSAWITKTERKTKVVFHKELKNWSPEIMESKIFEDFRLLMEDFLSVNDMFENINLITQKISDTGRSIIVITDCDSYLFDLEFSLFVSQLKNQNQEYLTLPEQILHYFFEELSVKNIDLNNLIRENTKPTAEELRSLNTKEAMSEFLELRYGI